MFKKFITVFLAFFLFVNTFAFAKETFSIEVGKNYYLGTENPAEIASLFGMGQEDLSRYLKDNNIVFLAVSHDGKSEIRLQHFETQFSKKVGNFAGYTEKELYTLSLDIIGTQGITGKIVKNNGLSFIKTEISTQNEVENYSVTQYTTVVDGKYYILTFYTDADLNRAYVQEVFESFTCVSAVDYSILEKEPNSYFSVILPTAAVLTVIATGGVLFLIFRDKFKKKEQ